MQSSEVRREVIVGVRDAAIECLFYVDEVIDSIRPAHLWTSWFFSNETAYLYGQLSRCQIKFTLLWDAATRDHFHMNRPRPDVRYGDDLTACEWAFSRVDDAKATIEVGRSTWRNKDEFSHCAFDIGDLHLIWGKPRLATKADIQAEWAAAIAGLNDAVPDSKEGQIRDTQKKNEESLPTEPIIWEWIDFLNKQSSLPRGSVAKLAREFCEKKKIPDEWENFVRYRKRYKHRVKHKTR